MRGVGVVRRGARSQGRRTIRTRKSNLTGRPTAASAERALFEYLRARYNCRGDQCRLGNFSPIPIPLRLSDGTICSAIGSPCLCRNGNDDSARRHGLTNVVASKPFGCRIATMYLEPREVSLPDCWDGHGLGKGFETVRQRADLSQRARGCQLGRGPEPVALRPQRRRQCGV